MVHLTSWWFICLYTQKVMQRHGTSDIMMIRWTIHLHKDIHCRAEWQNISGIFLIHRTINGSRELSSRVFSSRSRGCRLEAYQRHCIIPLSKALYLLISTGSTQEYMSWHDWKSGNCDVKNHIKQINKINTSDIIAIYRIIHLHNDMLWGVRSDISVIHRTFS